LIAVTLVFVTSISQVQAVNLFWSGNGTTQGGAGTWNTIDARWGTTAGGPYTEVWNNTNVDSAEFGATAGIVNLSGPVVVNTITTTLAGVVIGNSGTSGAANTITFSGADAGVNTTTTGTTTINAVMSASGGLVKSGPGRLEMGNIGTSQPSTNKYVINGGVISTASDARIGAAPGSLVQDFITFNGGGWAITTGNQSTGTNKGITIKSGGAFFGSSSTSINLTIASPIVGTEGGGITLTNVGPFVGNGSVQIGPVVMLTNTSNSWNGNVTIASGTLRVGASGVIPDTAVVSLTTAGTRFALGNFTSTFFNETVKSISGTAGTVEIGTGILTLADPAGESLGGTGVITASAGGKVVKNGSGAWSISNNSPGFNGEFEMNAGTLGIGAGSVFGNGADGTDASTFTYNGGVLSNTGTGGRTQPAGVTVNLNADLVADDSLFNSSQPGQILFNGVATLTTDRVFTINGTANVGFADLRESGGARAVTKNGAGTLAMTGTTAANANAFTGSVTVNAGRLQVAGASYVGNESNTIILNGGALNTSASRTVTIKNPINLTASSAITTTSTATTANFDFDATCTVTFGGGTVLTLRNDGGDAATDQLRVRFFNGAQNFPNNIDMPNGLNSSVVELSSFNTTGTQTFSGVISGTGNFKRSASTGGTGGTSLFTAQNTFSGGTRLNDGTIELGVDSVGPANNPTSGPLGTGTITVDNIHSPKLAASGGARNVGNSLAFEGGSVMGISGSNDLTLTGDVNLGASAAPVSRTITVSNSANSVMSGIISDGGSFAGSLTKSGGSPLSLTGANTYTGDTSVTAGLLSINNAYLANAADVYLTTGATFDLNFTTGSPDVIDSLFFDGVSQATGIWGGIGSGAAHETAFLTGSGRLQVTTFVPPPGLPGDFNQDNKVDAADYVTWRTNGEPNTSGTGPLPNDGGAADQNARLTLWRANFGNPGAGGGLGNSSGVPEPASVAMILAGLAMLAFGRRRVC
jgi:autotransporter-associated beta strand protein